MASITTLLQKLLDNDVAKFSAKKALFYSLLTVVFPIVLYNTLVTLNFAFVVWALNEIAGSQMSPVMIELSGFGAWMAQKMNLVQAFNVFITAVATRFLIGMVKGW